MGLVLYAAPEAEPISLDEAKAQLRVDIDEEDETILSYVTQARVYLEEISNRSFVSTTWDYLIDYDWPWTLDLDTNRHLRLIELPKAPLSSVTSITYVDTAGANQTLASNQYVVDGAGAIGRIYPAYGVTWPSVRDQPRAITVRFVAGYGAAAAVPEPIRQAIRLRTQYEHSRGEDQKAADAADALIATYRVHF